MTSEGSFRPLFLSGAIMIRNMRRPVRCVVSGQTVTDAWDSRWGPACTITTGRGFPKSPGTIAATTSPRANVIDREDLSQSSRPRQNPGDQASLPTATGAGPLFRKQLDRPPSGITQGRQ